LTGSFVMQVVAMADRIELTDDEWRKKLTGEQYRILRNSGTEAAFTGEYYHNKRKGSYLCAACGSELFKSETKYDSGSGWPSFYLPVKKDAVEEIPDDPHGMERTEVRCSRCGGHLGHVFDDGPLPTGLRYCINSSSLKFVERK
jgi:peptide-methionine (R)-S-oxide reductase